MIHIIATPQKDTKVSHHQISRNLIFCVSFPSFANLGALDAPQDVDAPKEEPKPKRQRRNRWGQDSAAAKCSTVGTVIDMVGAWLEHGWSRNLLFLACFQGT